MHTPATAPLVALIGFGEAGSTFALAGDWGEAARVYDIAEARRAVMEECGVRACATFAEALEPADIVLSLVTADSAEAVARDYASALKPGTIWCDMNSVAPETKRAAARHIEAAGGRYVDVAVLAPVDPARLNVPLLVAGADAEQAMELLGQLGFTKRRVVSEQVGVASSIKMIRSVMVKGLEALTAEMVLAANRAGVMDEIFTSLDSSEKQISWAERADYNLDRMLLHGLRRAAEMHESSETLRDLGIAPMMTENTVNWQQALGELGIRPIPDGLQAKLDAIAGSPAFKGEN